MLFPVTVSFPEISSFSLCSSEAISPCLWTGNLFPWKWMGCHKCSTMTSFQDGVREDGQQKRGLGLYQALMIAHCKSHLFEQIMGKRERVELDWDILEVARVGNKGYDDNCSLWDGSSCERKAIGLLFVSWMVFSICCKSYVLSYYSVPEPKQESKLIVGREWRR